MTMAAVMETPVAMATASRIARVDVISDFSAAEAIWRSLETSEQLSTPYQRFDFQSAWQTHIGVQEGLKPFIIICL